MPTSVALPEPRHLDHHWRADSAHRLILAAMVWVLIVFIIVPEGFNYANLAASAAPDSGSALSRLTWLALLGGGLLVVFSRARLAVLLLKQMNPFFLAWGLLAAASTLWSIDPGVTIRRMIRVVTIFVDAMAFVMMSWHLLRFQRVVRPIITLVLAGSIPFGLIFPQYGIHQETQAELLNAWRGLTNHKNSLGALACIGFVFWVHAWLAGEVPRLRALAGAIIAGCCLMLSRSATSAVTAIFTACFLLLLMRSPPRMKRVMPYLIGLFVGLLLVYSMAILRLVPGLEILLQPIVMITGKSLTFTGRSEIWAIIVEHISLRPLLGSGFGAYWTGLRPDTPSFEMVTKLYFYPGSAHNGYLEVVNDLGIVGLICLIGYLITYVRQALRLYPLDRNQSALFLALFLQQGISNFSETHWLSVFSSDFVIMTLATTTLARIELEQRLRFYFGAPGETAIPAFDWKPRGSSWMHRPAARQ
jgi:O-antigen ligase